MFNLSIELLRSKGACQSDCDLLWQAYPNGIISFNMEHYPRLKELGVNLVWSSVILPRQAQIELTKLWYQRALAGHAPPWKGEIISAFSNAKLAETLVAKHVLLRRLASNETERSVGGVGYAFSVLALAFASDSAPSSILNAICVAAQWASRCAANSEAVSSDVVYTEFGEQVFGMLVKYGSVL